MPETVPKIYHSNFYVYICGKFLHTENKHIRKASLNLFRFFKHFRYAKRGVCKTKEKPCKNFFLLMS